MPVIPIIILLLYYTVGAGSALHDVQVARQQLQEEQGLESGFPMGTSVEVPVWAQFRDAAGLHPAARPSLWWWPMRGPYGERYREAPTMVETAKDAGSLQLKL